MARRIGVLAIQGDFAKHKIAFEYCGAETKEIRKEEDLKSCDGLVIPGGESTTLTKLMNLYSLYNPILEFAENYPVMGTCAGLILLAKKVDDKRVKPLELLDITAERNAYGRQIESFIAELTLSFLNSDENFCAYFIRAPKIKEVGSNAKTYACYNEIPVMAGNDNVLAMCFHPELGEDFRIQNFFLKNF